MSLYRFELQEQNLLRFKLWFRASARLFVK